MPCKNVTIQGSGGGGGEDCPKGTVWDPSKGKCVPVDDGGGMNIPWKLVAGGAAAGLGAIIVFGNDDNKR